MVKSINALRETQKFWEERRASNEQDAQLESLEEFIEDSGHKMLAICMTHEKEFEEMLANDICIYLNDKLKEMEKLLNKGDIDGMML